MKISQVIITFNEEKNIGRCLKSACQLVDEIVVVDSGSTDRTEQIVREFGARWISREWAGYVDQKNYALKQASNEWILSMDADEALSPELLSELISLKSNENVCESIKGFSVPRCVHYEGRWIRNGDWYPDRLVRLFRKESGCFRGGKVHERLELVGDEKKLNGELEHYSFENSKDHQLRCEKYAKLWAEMKYEAGVTAWPCEGLVRGAWRFLRAFMFRQGFRDGHLGLRIAWYASREVLLKYKYLRGFRSRTV